MFKEFINDLLSQYNDGNWQSALIISTIIVLLSIVTHAVLFRIINHFRNQELANNLRTKLRIPSLVFLLTIAIAIIVISFAPDNLIAGYIKHILKLIIIFTITWLLIRFINLGRTLVLRRYDLEVKDNLKARRVFTQLRIIERILIFVVILIAFSASIMTFDSVRKIGVSLFASAGVAGIILGFAAQRLIGTVLAGFQIAVTQPIRLDDVVIVENEWGWIEEITLTYVSIRIWDKRRLIVPTTYFIEKPFQNWTRVSADILGTVFIYTDYTVPFEAMRKELTRILENDPNWDRQVNVLQVTDATEKTVEVRALMSAVDSPTAWNLRVNVREKLIEFLQKHYPDSLPRTRLSFEKQPENKEGRKEFV